MIDLLTLEQCYLSCLMGGADPCDVILTIPLHEKIHSEIKRLKNRGMVIIPTGLIPKTAHWARIESPNYVDCYADEIRDKQKRQKLLDISGKLSSKLPPDIIISDVREALDEIAAQTGKNEIITAADLQQKPFANTEFIIDKILPVGMTLLIGPPKMGKSWLLLLWADHISHGLHVFQNVCKKVPVLYYTLEDSIKRCKYRLNKLLGPNSVWSKNLYFCEKANGTKGVMRDIESIKARVVIIDTFGSFAVVKDGNDYYETTRIIREIKEIADFLQVAIIVVHHTRKNNGESSDWTNDIMGSQGLIGAADAIIALQRKRGEDKATLQITGRDITDNYIPLKWNDGYWETRHDA